MDTCELEALRASDGARFFDCFLICKVPAMQQMVVCCPPNCVKMRTNKAHERGTAREGQPPPVVPLQSLLGSFLLHVRYMTCSHIPSI